jgi:hypothetical protein
MSELPSGKIDALALVEAIRDDPEALAFLRQMVAGSTSNSLAISTPRHRPAQPLRTEPHPRDSVKVGQVRRLPEPVSWLGPHTDWLVMNIIGDSVALAPADEAVRKGSDLELVFISDFWVRMWTDEVTDA